MVASPDDPPRYQWTAKPSDKLWRWLMRILKYLAGTTDVGLTMKRDRAAPQLQAYVDAAFADGPDCKSTAGWLFLFQGALVAYDSTTIKRVVTSSTEAECCALVMVAKENIWQRRVVSELTGQPSTPTPVSGDNSASITMLSTGSRCIFI